MAKYQGFKMDIKLNGNDELVAKLRAMGKDMPAVLSGAVHAGAEPMYGEARRNAPGDGMTIEDATPSDSNTKTVAFGPDKDHWYYRFFETGVQPFEVNMVRRRTKRSAIDKAKTAKKGKTVLVRGRKIEGGTQALKFDGRFAKRIQRGAMPAQPFMRPAFDTKRDPTLDGFGDHVRRAAIDRHLESK